MCLPNGNTRYRYGPYKHPNIIQMNRSRIINPMIIFAPKSNSKQQHTFEGNIRVISIIFET